MEKMNVANKFWDKLGICGSTICLIHCLATPLLLMLFPAFNLGDSNEFVHEILAVFVMVSIMVAVFPKCHKHGHYDIIFIALLGMLGIGAGLYFHETSSFIADISTISGSILLIIAHIKNMRIRHGQCEGHAHN